MALQIGKLYSRVREKCNDEIELIAGRDGLGNLVRWMHMVEGVEISHFLEGNEVAFTTGIALKSDDELFELVSVAYQRGASGIVINVGPYIKQIPQQIMDFCNENSMPLFMMPWHAHMAHVMKFFAEEITLSDKRNMELISAVKNAVFFSGNYDLYVPALERYGYRIEWSYCIAVCECTDKHGDDVEESVLEQLKNAIENSIAMVMQSAVVFRIDSQIIMFFGNTDEEKIEKAVDDVLEALPDELSSVLNIYTGVGRNTKGMRCIYKAFDIAKKIAMLQRKRQESNKAASYSKLGVSRLFLTMDDPELMQEFYVQMLEPLVKYDEVNNTDFVGFLKAYFKYGGRVRETAEGMYLHRNSINYKLRKIEEILDCDFGDINEKAQLLIALKLMELL